MSEERLHKIIRKLEREVQRSEQARRVRENIADQQQIMLRKMGRDLERALRTVERQNVELSELAGQLEASLLEAGEARSRAEKANRAKSGFLSDMSHDLRTPINSLLGMLELLELSGLGEVQSQYMQVINAAADNILGLTESILDMERIGQGVLVLEQGRLDLTRLLERVCRVVSPDAQAREVEVICLPEPDLPGNLLGDERRLQQVLVNLAAAAVRCVRGGEVVLRAAPDPTLGPGGVLLEVSTEAGQDAELPSTEGAGEGTGLSTARKVVALMGSRLQERTEGGVCFSFRLRLQWDGPEPRPAPTLNQGAGKRVLVGSASANTRLAVRRMLEAWGAEVLTAASGGEVQAVARQAEAEGAPVVLAILDGDMGDVPGADAGMRLRFGVLAPPGVYVLCSLQEMSSMVDRARRMGLAGCLLKPLVRAELFAVLGEDDQRQGQQESGARDLNGVRVLIAEDNPANLMVLQLYLEETGCIIDSALDGKDALQQFSDNGADIVLMDIQMPVMDGYEATRALRRYELENSLERTPVVAVTADAFEHDRERALASGCDEYMPKPVRRNLLLETIARYTGRI